MLVEDGAMCPQGQMLAVLSNAELQLSTLARQAEVEQQINNMRSQELALDQTRATPTARPRSRPRPISPRPRAQYEMHGRSPSKGFVAGQDLQRRRDDL